MSYSTRYLDDLPKTYTHPSDEGRIWRVRYFVQGPVHLIPVDVQEWPFTEEDALRKLAEVPADYPAWIENTEGDKLLAQNAAKDEYDLGGKWTRSSRLLDAKKVDNA